MINKTLCIFLAFVSFLSIAQAANEKQAIGQVLNKFHQSAAQANAKEYLGLLTEDAIFLGTDASERWTKSQFTAFVLPYFNEGKGWRYEVKERNVTLLKHGTIAFFDEVLENSKYGYCRGSGVLIKTTTGWKISQYSLSLLVPNAIANEVAAKIKQYEQEK